MSRSAQYWRDRFLKFAIDQEASNKSTIRESHRLHNRAMRNIQRELDAFYRRYADSEGISNDKARQLLSKAEQKDWSMTLAEFRQKAIDGGFENQLNQEYYKSRISRLRRLQTQIDMELMELSNNSEGLLREHLIDAADTTYWRSISEIQKGSSLNTEFARFNRNMVDELVNKPFKGKHFSERVWGNSRSKLAKELTNTISDGIMRGDSIQDMTRRTMRRFDVTKNRATTLVQTETANICEQASQKSYRDTGVEEYEWLATLETNMCERCNKLHGKVFRVRASRTAGRNLPPDHPNCRCTTAPVIKF